MAMTADSSQNHHQADTINSPQKRKNLPSAWAQVVRGDPESVPPPPPLHNLAQPPPPSSSPEQSAFFDCSSPVKAASPSPPPPLRTENSESVESNNTNNGTNNAGTPKKAAWKKPSLPNGLAADVGSPVMGAVSWPALSESTNKASPKSSDSKVVSDGSSSSSMPTTPQGPVLPNSPQKQGSANAKANSTINHAVPARQKSMKRGGHGGGGGHSQSSFTHQPPPSPPPYPIFAMPANGYGNLVPVMPEQSPRGNNWEPRPIVGGFVTQPSVVNDHRHSSRRGNFGPRGDGSYHNNFGGRRDQDRGHFGNGRDSPSQPHRSPRGFVRPPPQNTAPFVPTQPVRPFFPDLVYIPSLPVEPYRGVPFIPHAPTSPVMPVPEAPLPDKLLYQIEYYFSDANLVKDNYLKSNMDDQGWVPITLIAGFNRVRSMTNDIHLILDSLRTSTILEVQDDKVRRRNDWMHWIPGTGRLPTDSSLPSLNASNHDLLTNSIQNMTMEEVAANQNSITVGSSSNFEDTPGSSSGLEVQPLTSQGIQNASSC